MLYARNISGKEIILYLNTNEKNRKKERKEMNSFVYDESTKQVSYNVFANPDVVNALVTTFPSPSPAISFSPCPSSAFLSLPSSVASLANQVEILKHQSCLLIGFNLEDVYVVCGQKCVIVNPDCFVSDNILRIPPALVFKFSGLPKEKKEKFPRKLSSSVCGQVFRHLLSWCSNKDNPKLVYFAERLEKNPEGPLFVL